MDASMRKTFQVKVRSLTRTLKEYRIYKLQVESYNLNEVSQDKKKQEFYQESKSALDQVEKKLIDFFQQLKSYVNQNEETIQQEEDPTVQGDYVSAKAQIEEVQALLPAAV